MRHMIGIIPLFLFLLILSACGSLSSGSGSSSESKQPPEATITIDGKAVSYIEGTYCWSTSGQGVCVDKSGAEELTKDSDPLVVNKKGKIKISYEEQPTELYVKVLKNELEQQQIQDKYSFQIPSKAGTYVYDIFARWKDKGDLAIAFKIKVK